MLRGGRPPCRSRQLEAGPRKPEREPWGTQGLGVTYVARWTRQGRGRPSDSARWLEVTALISNGFSGPAAVGRGELADGCL